MTILEDVYGEDLELLVFEKYQKLSDMLSYAGYCFMGGIFLKASWDLYNFFYSIGPEKSINSSSIPMHILACLFVTFFITLSGLVMVRVVYREVEAAVISILIFLLSRYLIDRDLYLDALTLQELSSSEEQLYQLQIEEWEYRYELGKTGCICKQTESDVG